MQWLNQIADELIDRHPDGEILIESGASPSGTYHLGHLRELLTPDAIVLELQRRHKTARHIHFVDDLDALRKIPVNVPKEFEKYLGMPLCDAPAPDGSSQSYADYFLTGLIYAGNELGIEVEYIRSSEKYRDGYFVPAIERCLDRVVEARHALEGIAGRKLDNQWTPIQILEEGRLKNREYVSIDKITKLISYKSANGETKTAQYDQGEVKLDWRLDWPGRWWLQNVQCEPSGRDHMTKGSSYDTGVQIMRDVYDAEPPYPVAYDFINMVGDTKKMSASKGTGLDAVEGSQIMPAEVIRYFVFRAPPSKRLFFDPVNGVVQLMDEFAALAAKENKTSSEEQLLYICTRGSDRKTVSRIPFSLLVASYQAALQDEDQTIETVRRTEYAEIVDSEAEIIKSELKFIEAWLEKRAPEEVKFKIQQSLPTQNFSAAQRQFMMNLAEKITKAPEDADGAWFHTAIYSFKESSGLTPKELFTTLYQLIIAKDSGPRAGWFLSLLPRDWLIKRLRFEA